MHRISPAEAQFINDGISQGLRNDGRGRTDLRPVVLETGLITQASGSARIQMGETDLLVGVKAEVGEPDADRPDDGVLKISVECSPSISPEFEGRGAEDINTSLARTLERLIANPSVVDLKKLCILPGQKCWVLYTDVVVLDAGGNLVDAISMGIKAALHNTIIPKVAVVMTGRPGEIELEVDDDPDSSSRFDADVIPVCISVARVGNHHIVDPSLEEEQCVAAKIITAISKDGKLCGMQKEGSAGLELNALHEMLKLARKAGLQLHEHLSSALKMEDKTLMAGKQKLGFFA